jgi:hypothetical protein
MCQPARHSILVRFLSIAGGLVLSISSVAAAPAGLAAASRPASPSAASAKAVADSTARYGTATSRGQVNVRELALTSKVRKGIPARPAIRPARKAPKADGVAPRTATASPPVQATTTAAPVSTITTFDGIHKDTPLETNVEPPDPYVAVGPDDVVEVVNLMVRITDRNGASPIDVTLPDFFGLPATGLFGDADPRIVYDPLHARWVAIELSWDCIQSDDADFGHGYIDIAISNTADPRGTWSIFYRTYPDQFPDYPGLGTSTDKVAVSANLYNMVPEAGALECVGNTYQGADFTVLDWSDLVNGGGLSYWNLGPYPARFTIRPAIQSPPTVSPLRWVGYLDNGSGWDEETGTILGSVLAGTVSTSGSSLSDLVSPPLIPGQPRQPGSPATIADAVDERITDAIWQNNELTWVSTYPCTPTGDSAERDCVRVTQLNTSSRTLLQDFLVAQNGEDLYMGGVGVSGNGALHVVWTQSSATAGHYPSTYGAYQLPTDAANSLSTPQLLGAGDSTYLGTRWGDYVGVAQDPQDPNAVSQAGEFTDTGQWATNVTSMNIGVGSTFKPITPVRVLNTIAGVGLTNKFTANVPRTFQVAGSLGIPANAKAITANLTVTQQSGAGYVSVTPTPTASPPVSTINFPLGDNRANNLTTRLSSDGKLSAVYKALAGKTTHLILDVTGYFLEDDTGATFNSITPVRVLNTVGDVGLPGPFTANVPLEFQVGGVTVGEVTIPSDAIAISGNLTVTRQTAAGHVSVTPEETATPQTSTINFPVGDNRANGLVVPLSATGSLWAVYKATTGSTVDLILDVTGYYLNDLTGVRFYPLNPGRRLNPLAGIPPGITIFSANVPQTIVIAGHHGVQIGATAITGNLTVTQQTRAGYASITPNPTVTPQTSTINFPVGDNRANGVTVQVNGAGSLSLVYKATSPATTVLLLDVTGYFK